MDGFGGGPPFMRDDGLDGMPRRGDHGPPMMHHSLPGDLPNMLGVLGTSLDSAGCSLQHGYPKHVTEPSFLIRPAAWSCAHEAPDITLHNPSNAVVRHLASLKGQGVSVCMGMQGPPCRAEAGAGVGAEGTLIPIVWATEMGLPLALMLVCSLACCSLPVVQECLKA